jgi:hypothetical protein
VVCGQPQTRELFRLAGLDRRLRLARTRAEALQALWATADPQPRSGEATV